jgi:peptidoglycan-associated lipoprotein
MNFKIVGAFAAVALLAACSHKPAETSAGAMTQTTQAPPPVGIVPGSQEDLVANVGDRVFFEFNKSTLTDDAQKTLGKQADWLAKYPTVKVQLAGNADERGTEEYNLALGNRRANAARDFLVAKGVSAARITTISYGKDRPVALGSNEQAYAQNRNSITSVR